MFLQRKIYLNNLKLMIGLKIFIAFMKIKDYQIQFNVSKIYLKGRMNIRIELANSNINTIMKINQCI